MRCKWNGMYTGLFCLLAFSAIALMIVTAFGYLMWTGFGEQGEVQFASVSALLYQGYPLYTTIDGAGRYSLQHGPIVYLVAGAVMQLFGASYITVKLAGAMAPALVLLISWIWFSKITTKKYAFLFLGLQTWILFHWHHIFYIRPDSLMLLMVVVSMAIVTTTEKKWLLVLGTAIPMGIMLNLKIHGFLYFFPIMGFVYQRTGLRYFAHISGLAITVGVLPFLMPQISFGNYLSWVTQSVHHGFAFKNFVSKIAMLFVLFIIPYALAVLNGVSLSSFFKRHKFVVTPLLISLFITSVIASKVGSGTNHLMPYLPIIIYYTIILFNDMQAGFLQNVKYSKIFVGTNYLLLGIIILVILSSGFTREYNFFKMMHEDNNNSGVILNEIQSIEKQFAGKTISLGYGEDRSYIPYRDYIPYLVFHNNPLLIEAVAFMDMKSAKIPMPEATIKQLEEGTIQVWLIPAGDKPFTMNHADKGPLFDNSFRKAFLDNYHLISKTPHFDIWVYQQVLK